MRDINDRNIKIYRSPRKIHSFEYKRIHPLKLVVVGKDTYLGEDTDYIIEEIPYEGNDKISYDSDKSFYDEILKKIPKFGTEFTPRIGIVNPVQRVDIPDVREYSICGLYGQGVKKGCNIYDIRECKTMFDELYMSYWLVYNIEPDMLKLYYGRGNVNGSNNATIKYYGSSIDSQDFFHHIKDFQNIQADNNVFCISYKDLNEFYNLLMAVHFYYLEDFLDSQAYEYLLEVEQPMEGYEEWVAYRKSLKKTKKAKSDAKTKTESQSAPVNVIQNKLDKLDKDLGNLVFDRYKDVIKRFVIFTTQRDKTSGEGLFNMILYSNDKERICKLVELLNNSLECSQEAYTITEEALLNNYRENNWIKFNVTNRIIHISECGNRPFVDPNAGTGRKQDSQIEALKEYNNFWEALKYFINMQKNKIFILSMNKSVYNTSFCNRRDLTDYYFQNVIYIGPTPKEDIFEMFKNNIPEERATPEFFDGLKKYIDLTYSHSEVKGKKYYDQLYHNIATNYYSIEHENRPPLGIECIPQSDIPSVDEIMEQVNKLPGLYTVKKVFERLSKTKVYEAQHGVTKNKNRYHMAFVGNSGTGKTTVARMVADMYYSMGIIKTRKLVEKRASDLIGKWSNSTRDTVKAIVEEARYGVLFIDEAYGFLNQNKEYGGQAIDALMKTLDVEPVILIIAGYEDEINELYDMNPGLKSRIGEQVLFEDYTKEDLLKILVNRLEKRGFIIEDHIVPLLEECISAKMSEVNFGNAREISKLSQRIDEEYKNSVVSSEFPDDNILRKEMLDRIMPKVEETRLDKLIGIRQVRERLDSLKKAAVYKKVAKEYSLNIPSSSMHMIFTGNPGTGKTTVAKLFAQELYNAGVLDTNKTIILEPKDLAGNSKESPVMVFKRKLREAKGGILFIDEAYSITNKGSIMGMQIVEELLTAMIDYKDQIIFIFAGYEDEMFDFMEANPGLKSRIGHKIHFKDYDPDELVEIFKMNVEQIGYTYEKAVLEEVKRIVLYYYGMKDLGNARFVEHLISLMIDKIGKRYCRKVERINRLNKNLSQPIDKKITKKDITHIYVRDVPSLWDVYVSLPGNERMVPPTERDEEDRRRTVYHELGHAVASIVAAPEKMHPRYLYFVKNFMSNGRVVFHGHGPRTEQEYMAHLTMLLAGRNAERMIYGDNSSGCSSDYMIAKNVSKRMAEEYAMGELLSANQGKFLKEADAKATEILLKYKAFIVDIADKIMNDNLKCMKDYSIKGEDFKKLFDKFNSNIV